MRLALSGNPKDLVCDAGGMGGTQQPYDLGLTPPTLAYVHRIQCRVKWQNPHRGPFPPASPAADSVREITSFFSHGHNDFRNSGGTGDLMMTGRKCPLCHSSLGAVEVEALCAADLQKMPR